MSAHPTVDQLMRDKALLEQLRAAHVVVAVDYDGSELVVHGLEVVDLSCDLELAADSQAGDMHRARWLTVAVDSRTDDLDLLALVVRSVKDAELGGYNKSARAAVGMGGTP